jgi:hypothetical protein
MVVMLFKVARCIQRPDCYSTTERL